VLKKRFVFAALLCLFTVSVGWTQELATRLGNKEVIEMVGLGLSDDVIVEKIRTAPETKFDTSLDALKELKTAKVPDTVIKAMINPRAPVVVAAVAAPAPAAPVLVSEDPNLPPKDVGVYWKDADKFVFIEGQMVSQAKIGGRAAHAFTYGIKSKHWNAYLPGNESKNKVKDSRPMFYFYVPEGNSGNDYTLLKLDKKGDRRQFEVGSIGGWTGQKSGVRESNTRGFEAERVASRTYKVTLNQDLPAGEYGFFMGTGQQMALSDKEAGGSAQGRIYDFSISK
jgi:hypothetical protein